MEFIKILESANPHKQWVCRKKEKIVSTHY